MPGATATCPNSEEACSLRGQLGEVCQNPSGGGVSWLRVSDEALRPRNKLVTPVS